MAQKFTVPITVKQLSSAGSDALTVYVDADTYARLKLEAGGRLTWGDGTAIGDVNLYRDEANVLRTDDTFKTPTLFVDNIEIDTTGATTNQVLAFNGTKFVPSASVGSVTNVLYVAKNGNDSNDGTTLNSPKLTIKAALAIASADTTVFVKSGDYTEANPVTIPAKVSVVGDSARAVTVRPLTTNQDIFYVNNASYVTGISFRDHVSPAAAIAYNPNGSAGTITQSPYVFDCSSLTTTGTGMRIDGDAVSGGKSMLAGQFTQINLGGKGIHLLNRGYAQLIAIYTICCDVSILCESGGFCSLIGSDTSFGNYGLKAVGVSGLLYSGTTSASVAVNETQVTIGGLPNTPYVNNVVTFDDGTTYYAIDNVTPISGGSSTITLDQRLSTSLGSGVAAKFYQASKITASNHTFEYCGAGIDLVNSRPQFGGIPIQANEVVEESGGQVFYTSTDHKGDFRIGSELKIDRGSGAIDGIAFDRSLFAVMTPYILAIEG